MVHMCMDREGPNYPLTLVSPAWVLMDYWWAEAQGVPVEDI